MARISADDRREQLIAAALRVAARDGLHRATTRAIVKEAGMSLASFHYVFESRDELLGALIERVVSASRAVSAASIVSAESAVDALRLGIRAYFDNVIADPGHEQAMFQLTQYALYTGELKGLPQRQYDAYHRAAAELLALGAEVLEFEWSAPVDEVARLLVAFTDGITLAWLADRDSEAAHRLIDLAATSIASLARTNEFSA